MPAQKRRKKMVQTRSKKYQMKKQRKRDQKLPLENLIAVLLQVKMKHRHQIQVQTIHHRRKRNKLSQIPTLLVRFSQVNRVCLVSQWRLHQLLKNLLLRLKLISRQWLIRYLLKSMHIVYKMEKNHLHILLNLGVDVIHIH